MPFEQPQACNLTVLFIHRPVNSSSRYIIFIVTLIEIHYDKIEHEIDI